MSKPERHAAGASPKRGAPPKGAPKSARPPPHGAKGSFVAKKGGAPAGGMVLDRLEAEGVLSARPPRA